MKKLLICVFALLATGFAASNALGQVNEYLSPEFQVGGKLVSEYAPGAVVESFGSPLPATQPPRILRNTWNRTYPGGIAPYRRYGMLFGFTRRNIGESNPYQGMDPEAGNPYAGYTITRGPRDFLMKNPPNIGQ